MKSFVDLGKNNWRNSLILKIDWKIKFKNHYYLQDALY